MAIRDIKDIIEAMEVSVKIVGKLGEEIRKLITSGNHAYQYLSAKREYSRLKDMSARLTFLGNASSAKAIKSIEVYLMKDNPSHDDWARVCEPISETLEEVWHLLSDIKRERSDLVLQGSYEHLISILSWRESVLNMIYRIDSAPSQEELKKMSFEYKNLIISLKNVTKEFNSYIKSISNTSGYSEITKKA